MSEVAKVSATTNEIRLTLAGGYPFIYAVTTEEDRAIALIRAGADLALDPGYELWTWSVTRGLSPDGGEPLPETQAAADALRKVIADQGRKVYVFKDLHPWLEKPDIVRLLRDVYHSALDQGRYLFVLSPVFTLPLELRKEAAVIDIPPPTLDELAPVVDAAIAACESAGRQTEPLTDDQRLVFLRAVQGLTVNEARHVLAKALADRGFDDTASGLIQTEKARLIRKEGMLQFVPQNTRIDDVGGLEHLKDWLKKRRALFRRDPDEVGELLPRGLLMMGISGCGKSLSVKAISHHWDLPLFRLDMNEVFGGAHGVPEQAFARGLRAAESLAPCILWIDEIEGGITGYESEGGGSTWRIFSTFLTWMQEKSAPVFVAATANRIDLLPAEVLRKGRFDQIFFLDLPSEEDRAEIFRVHLAKRGNDVAEFELSILARGSKGWNGAEIENCVVSGTIEAFADDRPLRKEDLYDQLSALVPLATTMAEQIKAIRSWAHDRAMRAGKQ